MNMKANMIIAAMLFCLMPYAVGAQSTEINSRDLRSKVAYQDDHVVFRQPTVSNGNNGGMDMMVDGKGVRINFSSRSGMK